MSLADRLPATLLCLLLTSVATPAHADFQEVQLWLEQNQPVDLDMSCRVLSAGATKVVCNLTAHPGYALLVSKEGENILATEISTGDELAQAGVAVARHGALFELVAVSVTKKLKEKSYPALLKDWIPGTEIEGNLRDFNSVPHDFWKTGLGKAARQEGVGVPQLKTTTVASLEKLLAFTKKNRKYVVDVEMFIVADGTIFLSDLAGGFGNRGGKVDTWLNQLTGAITAIQELAD